MFFVIACLPIIFFLISKDISFDFFIAFLYDSISNALLNVDNLFSTLPCKINFNSSCLVDTVALKTSGIPCFFSTISLISSIFIISADSSVGLHVSFFPSG